MKQIIFALVTSAIIMAPAFATSAQAAGTGTVTNVIHNTVGAVHSIVGGAGTTTGGSAGSMNGSAGASIGASPNGIDIASGLGLGSLISSGGQNDPATNGFYLGAQSDGNGLVSFQITKTLFRF